MIQTEAYFDNIQETLLNELKTAKRTIYVAVAWFTDTRLFEQLIEKLQDNVQVSVAIVKDKINDDSWNNFNLISQNGGHFFAIKGALMHNKFCVIDERVVVTGSYNWTYKAATQNLENIIVTYNDYDLAFKFVQQFQQITGQNSKNKNIDKNRIIKRLNIVKNLLLLEEDEMLGAQIAKLKQESEEEIITKVENAIKQRYFSTAVDLIEQFVIQNSKIAVYENPLIMALRLELQDLEYRILAIDNSITEREKILRDYTLQFNQYLGNLIKEIYFLKKELLYRDRQESQNSEEEYQKAKEKYEEYTKQREHLSDEKTHILTVEDKKRLKYIYRQAALHCHPDRVSKGKENEAEEVFKVLQSAYQQQDLAEVERIFDDVKNGIFTKVDITDSTLEELQHEVINLRQKMEHKTGHLRDLENNTSYQTAINIDDWSIYFETLKTELKDEKERWKNKLTD